MPSDTCTNCGYAAKRQNPDCGEHPMPVDNKEPAPAQPIETDSERCEEANRLHGATIDKMRAMGYGLLKDGETFYLLGYELLSAEDLHKNFCFTMRQGYAIVHAAESLIAQREAAAYDRGAQFGADIATAAQRGGERQVEVLIAAARRGRAGSPGTQPADVWRLGSRN